MITSVRYELVADEAFYRTAFARHRQARWWNRLFAIIRYLGFALLASISLFAFNKGEVIDAVLFASFAIVCLFARAIDWLVLKYRLSKSPFLGEPASLSLDDEGLNVEAPSSKTFLRWATCTKAVERQDGLLLYYGPGLFYWLPHDRVSEGVSQTEIVDFVGSRVRLFRVLSH